MNKIILVSPSLQQGGAERVMSELSNHWSINDYEVHLVLLSKSKSFYKINSKVIIHQLGFENVGKIQKIVSELQTFKQLRIIIKIISPQFVLCFMEKYNVFTIVAAAGLKTKIFVSDRSNPKARIPKSIDFLRRRTYKYATGIIAQTSLAKEILTETTKNKNIEVIPNPLKAVDIFDKKREKIILNVGRLVVQKGQQFLLEAFACLPDNSWQLVILGDGPLKSKLLQRAKELGIYERVKLPGSVPNVDEWLARASIFAFPSISEGFPNALMEAMSAGIACVSFDCDAGPKDIIRDEINGFLINVGDIVGLTKRLAQLQNDENLRNHLGECALKVKDNFSMNKIAQQYLNFCMR